MKIIRLGAAIAGIALVLLAGPTALAATTPAPSTWRGVAPASLPYPSGSFSDVSCPNSQFCMAVGTETVTASKTQPVAETFNGQSWRRLHPTDTPAGNLQLTAVSCSDTTSCTALGLAFPSRSWAAISPVAEHWDGRSWRFEPLPDTASTLQLFGISCPTPSFCVAAGTQRQTSHSFADVIDIWHAGGAGWHPSSLPTVAGSPSLTGVSCTSASFCLAVGSRTQGDTDYSLLAWNGHRWSTASLPSAADRVALTEVSCATSRYCGVIGIYGKNQYALVGSQGLWDLQTLPHVRGGMPNMTAISCPAQGSCYTAGGRAVPASAEPTSTNATEVWNGQTWTALYTPGRAPSNLTGVSCTSSSTCMAVGAKDYITGAGHTSPIAEEGGAQTAP
jgi:hypothetical protein